jgi:hypothetical protein
MRHIYALSTLYLKIISLLRSNNFF